MDLEHVLIMQLGRVFRPSMLGARVRPICRFPHEPFATISEESFRRDCGNYFEQEMKRKWIEFLPFHVARIGTTKCYGITRAKCLHGYEKVAPDFRASSPFVPGEACMRGITL